MENLQEQPTPALVIHRYGRRQYCVLPAGVDPNGDVARDQYLLISSRRACEAFIRERMAIEEARAAAAPAQNGHAPPLDPETYAAKVRQAYRELAEQRSNPDVPIAELYGRVGGGLGQLHSFLDRESHEGRCAPSSGEWTLAGEAAKRSSLTLPGEVDRLSGQPLRFLNVKLIEAQEQAQKVAPPAEPEGPKEPPVRFNVALTRAEIDLLRQALDDQCRAIAARADANQVTRLQAFTDLGTRLDGLQPQQAVKPLQPESVDEPKVQPEPVKAPEQPELAEHEAYRRELVERARAKYPNATLELAARIDKEIKRRVEMVRTYEQHLLKTAADGFPNATPEEKATHQVNIRREVSEYRQALETHLQQQREHRQRQREQAQHQPPSAVRARQQQRGFGIER